MFHQCELCVYTFIYVFVLKIILVLLEVYNVHRERALWPKGLILNENLFFVHCWD